MTSGRILRPLHRVWTRRKRAMFPTGAVVWHLEAWRRPALSPEQQTQAAALRLELGLDQLWIVHGGALAHAGRCHLLTGPAGIGKSSALLELERAGEGEIVEDGLLLLGQTAARWQLVRTGTLSFMRTNTKISRLLRRAAPLSAGSVWRDELSAAPGRRLRMRFFDALAVAAFRLAVIAHRPEKETSFVAGTMPIERVLHVAHADDPHVPIRVESDGRLVADRDVVARLAAATEVVEVSPSTVLDRLRDALRAATMGGAPVSAPVAATPREMPARRAGR